MDKTKLQKKICQNDMKKFGFLQRYLEWTEGRGDNGKECTKTKGNWTNIDTEAGPQV